MECKVTTGSPPLTVFWENVKSGQVIIGKLLNITHITRYQTEYRCIANNTCGSDSSTIFIDVQCKNISFSGLFFTMYTYNLRIIQPVNYKTASGKRKVGIVLIIFLPLLVTKREIIICGVSNIPIKRLRTRPGPGFENSLSVPFRFRLFHPQFNILSYVNRAYSYSLRCIHV